jgi:hypothetical protein
MKDKVIDSITDIYIIDEKVSRFASIGWLKKTVYKLYVNGIPIKTEDDFQDFLKQNYFRFSYDEDYFHKEDNRIFFPRRDTFDNFCNEISPQITLHRAGMVAYPGDKYPDEFKKEDNFTDEI